MVTAELPKNTDVNKLPLNLSTKNIELLKIMNTTIKEVTKAIDDFHFNIAVASIRRLFNSTSAYKIENEDDSKVIIYVTKTLLILINPMVPHLAEELWYHLGNKEIIANQNWPQVDLNYIQNDNVKIPIQVNGKVGSY